MKTPDKMIGRTFGKLTVINRAESHKGHTGDVRRRYKCRCSCGAEILVIGRYLRKEIQNTRACKSCSPRMEISRTRAASNF